MGGIADAHERAGRESWDEFRARVGDDLLGAYLRGERVSVPFKFWRITLDTNVVAAGEAGVAVTRVRAPFLRGDRLRFELHRRGLLDALGRACGIHTSDTGESDFDRTFAAKTNDEDKLRQLLGDGEIRRLIRAQPSINLEVRDGDGPFGARLPEGVAELCLRAAGFVSDPAQIRQLFALMALLLERLGQIGSAQERDPGVTL